jgi:hypothetical protein
LALKDHVRCYSVRFNGFAPEHYHDYDVEDILAERLNYYPTFYEYRSLSEDKPTDEMFQRQWNYRSGSSLNFSFHPSGTVGMLEHTQINPSGMLDAQASYEGLEEYDPYLWDSQYLRYMQVLDSDKDYIILYKCLETAMYSHENRIYNDQEAWERSHITAIDF